MHQPDPYQSVGRQNLAWIVAGLGILVGVLAFGFGSGILKLPGAQAKSGLEKPGSVPQPSLGLPGAAPAPVLNKQAEPAPGLQREAKRMPDDVRAWLEHLERIERRRKEMSHDQMAAVLVQMTSMNMGAGIDALKALAGGDLEALDEKSPTQDLTKDIEAKRGAWSQLQSDFRSMPPPAECAGIAAAYTETLGETGAMIVEVMEAVAKSSEDPQAAVAVLSKMRGTSASRIDEAAGSADQQLADICAKYDTSKWFSISRDFGGGALGKVGGMPSVPGMPAQ